MRFVHANRFLLRSKTLSEITVWNEGHGNHTRRQFLATHDERYRRIRFGESRLDIAHGDGAVDAGAEAAGGDHADFLPRDENFGALARRLATFGQDADTKPRRAFLQLALDARCAAVIDRYNPMFDSDFVTAFEITLIDQYEQAQRLTALLGAAPLSSAYLNLKK